MHEYLIDLRNAHSRKVQPEDVPKPDDIVIVHSDKVPKMFWKTGIIGCLRGRDGIVRSCRVMFPWGIRGHQALNTPLGARGCCGIYTSSVSLKYRVTRVVLRSVTVRRRRDDHRPRRTLKTSGQSEGTKVRKKQDPLLICIQRICFQWSKPSLFNI